MNSSQNGSNEMTKTPIYVQQFKNVPTQFQQTDAPTKSD